MKKQCKCCKKMFIEKLEVAFIEDGGECFDCTDAKECNEEKHSFDCCKACRNCKKWRKKLKDLIC